MADNVSAIYKAQLERNLRAFLKAKGQEFNPEKTLEYMTSGANLLKKTYGIKLAAYICRTDSKRFSKWVKGEDLPAAYEAGGLLEAIEITETLLGRLKPVQASEWMKTPHEYLFFNLPMDFMRTDPSTVRNAALQLF